MSYLPGLEEAWCSAPSASGGKSKAKPWCCRGYISEGWICSFPISRGGVRGWEERGHFLPTREEWPQSFCGVQSICVPLHLPWVLGMREIPSFFKVLLASPYYLVTQCFNCLIPVLGRNHSCFSLDSYFPQLSPCSLWSSILCYLGGAVVIYCHYWEWCPVWKLS